MRDRRRAVGGLPTSPVEDHNIGSCTDGNRGASRRRSGRKREDGARHKRADGANREDGRSEDVSPNSHDCLHAFTEVNCLDPGSAALDGHLCPFTSLWLIT